MNNILSGTKYRASPEGVSLMDETNNLASHVSPHWSPDGWALIWSLNPQRILLSRKYTRLFHSFVKSVVDPNLCVIISHPSDKCGLERSPLIHSYGYGYYGHPALALRARFAHATAPGKFVRGRSSNLPCQLAPKIKILHAICGLKGLALFASFAFFAYKHYF